MKFAVIEAGGKQYKVTPGMKLKIARREDESGKDITFDKVLLFADGENIEVGKPYVSGKKVNAKVLDHGRDDKKIVFKYKSKTGHRKKKGHRQPYTEVQIEDTK